MYRDDVLFNQHPDFKQNFRGRNFKVADNKIITYADNTKYYYERFGEFEDEDYFNPGKKQKIIRNPPVPKHNTFRVIGEKTLQNPDNKIPNKRNGILKNQGLSAR